MAKYIHVKGISLQNIHNFKHLSRDEYRDLEAGKKTDLSEAAVRELRKLNVWIRKISNRSKSK